MYLTEHLTLQLSDYTWHKIAYVYI